MTEKTKKPLSIHELLSYSYLVFLISFLLGITLEIFFSFGRSFSNIGLGYLFLILGTTLVLWAQSTSKTGKKDRIAGNLTISNFFKGPYKITRTPTHLGMFLTVLGAGFIWGSLWIVIMSLFSYIFTKVTFVAEEERILEKRYGAPYLEYKKKMKI